MHIITYRKFEFLWFSNQKDSIMYVYRVCISLNVSIVGVYIVQFDPPPQRWDYFFPHRTWDVFKAFIRFWYPMLKYRAMLLLSVLYSVLEPVKKLGHLGPLRSSKGIFLIIFLFFIHQLGSLGRDFYML